VPRTSSPKSVISGGDLGLRKPQLTGNCGKKITGLALRRKGRTERAKRASSHSNKKGDKGRKGVDAGQRLAEGATRPEGKKRGAGRR